jgi:Domain of unknown function (DUF4221)
MVIKKIVGSILIPGMIFQSCTSPTVDVKNAEQGKLKPVMKLVNTAEKKFALDSNTAARCQYIQIYTDSGKRYFTFLNTYKNAVYFYDYQTSEYIKQITYKKKGADAIPLPMAYYIKTPDSIYVFERRRSELALTNSTGKVLGRISLINNRNPRDYSWVYSFPQYYPYTATPILETKNKLVFPGQYMLSPPDSLVDKFKFESLINLADNKVRYFHRYPRSLYGNDYNWESGGIYTTVYFDLARDPGQIVYSFPVSHDLYLADIDSDEYKTVYGGSNNATDITSFAISRRRKTPLADLLLKTCKTDLYAAIKYDKYRRVYYRFLRRAVPDATNKTTLKDKPVAVIIFDENFHYLGETDLGTGNDYNWQNSFVTEEGLNVEFIDSHDLAEKYLNLKIFLPEKIN